MLRRAALTIKRDTAQRNVRCTKGYCFPPSSPHPRPFFIFTAGSRRNLSVQNSAYFEVWRPVPSLCLVSGSGDEDWEKLACCETNQNKYQALLCAGLPGTSKKSKRCKSRLGTKDEKLKISSRNLSFQRVLWCKSS